MSDMLFDTRVRYFVVKYRSRSRLFWCGDYTGSPIWSSFSFEAVNFLSRSGAEECARLVSRDYGCKCYVVKFIEPLYNSLLNED